MSEDVFHSVSMIMNVDPEEIAKIVHDYINRGIVSDYDRLNCPKPPIYIGPVKVKSLKERLEEATMHTDCEFCVKRDICTRDVPKPCRYRYTEEERIADQASDQYGAILNGMYLPKTYQNKKEENEMKPTSVWTIENIDDISITQDGDEISLLLKNRDDLTKITLIGDAIKNHNDNFITTLKIDMEENAKTMYEQDQKIRELEKENKDLKKRYDRLNKKFNRVMNDNLPETPITDAMIVDDYNRMVEENKQLREDKEYAENLNKELIDRWQKRYGDILEENKLLKKELAFEKAANEAQHKFIREYAGKGTEVPFNYVVNESDNEVSYVVVDKKTYDEKPNINLHGKDFTPDELVDRVLELEKKNLDLQKAYDILDKALDGSQKACNKWYEKWVKMLSEQEEKIADNVNHPSHYTSKYECIDVMQDVFGDEATNDFCLCNAFKYIWRARKKNGLEDVKKAVWYLNKYIEEAEKDGVPKGK